MEGVGEVGGEGGAIGSVARGGSRMHTCSSVTLVCICSSSSLSPMLPSDGGLTLVPVFLYLVLVFSHREKMLWIACDVAWRRGRRQHTLTSGAAAHQARHGVSQRRAEGGVGRWRRGRGGAEVERRWGGGGAEAGRARWRRAAGAR